LKTYLFTSADIMLTEQEAEHSDQPGGSNPANPAAAADDAPGFSFTVGSLRKEVVTRDLA
jgi:hypothetical protein